ncbi:uncharacterized protein [Arachis hypogaea]|uniref:uncharacterized protein n=1 Tax=Arachis hypogaea TaxID=3818 RepID=UPI003B21E501
MEKPDVFQPIPVILNGSNYAHWVEAMRGFLKGRKLWRYVTGDIACPVKPTLSKDGASKSKEDAEKEKDYAEKLEDWDSKNHQIITWFRNTSTPGIHLQFGRFETAKEVWDHLAKRYTISDLSHQYQLLKELHSLKQERGQAVFDFLAQMEIIWDQLTSCEPVLKDPTDAKAYEDYRNRTRLIQFLMALTDDYEPVRASLLHQNPLPSLEDALPRLKSEETRLGLLRSKSETVFAATDRKGKICRNCNRPGHSFSDCPSIECRKCKQKGHIGSNCPKLFCHYCKLSGHLISTCPTRPPRSDQNKYQPRPNHSSHVPASAAANESTSSTSLNTPSVSPSDIETLLRQLLSFSGNTPATLSTSPGNSKWYFDSGCFNHMSPLRHLFSSLSPTTNAPSVNTANGSLLHATHHGVISQSNIHLSDAYFIPKLTFNLISVGQLVELGFDVIFSNSGCRVQDRRTGKIIGTGCKVGRLFELENLHVPSSHLCAASSPSTLHLWHRHLAHSSLGKLRPLISTGVLGQVQNESLDCISCHTAKQPALSFNNNSSIACSPFDLIHSDVWGPAPTASMGGARYFVLFIDDYSRSTPSPPLEAPDPPPSPSPDDSSPDGDPTPSVMPPPPTQTFAPVARLTSVRALLAIAAVKRWSLSQMDVKNAFLNGDLKQRVYMKPPPGYPCPSSKVCLLRKALYGLKQAPREWFDKFSTTICSLGFISSPHENALFIRKSDRGVVLLLLYVDDMIITGDDVDGISDLKTSLQRTFEMKDLGSLSYFLGLEVISTDDGIYLSQAKYASDLLARAGITDSRTESTPLEPNVRFTPMDGTVLDNPTLYRQLVGGLVYLTVTRPDIAYPVHVLSQFLSAPRTIHYAAVLRILRYVKGTLFHGLYFSAHSSLTLQAYSDADWAGDPTDRRSTTGYCLFLGDALISWRAKKQTFTARSSTEAEYRALADTTAEVISVRWLLEDLGAPQSSPTDVFCDNRSAIQIAHNDVFHERTKHIEIDCHFVRQRILIDAVSSHCRWDTGSDC